jgi:hypothetical protein
MFKQHAYDYTGVMYSSICRSVKVAIVVRDESSVYRFGCRNLAAYPARNIDRTSINSFRYTVAL